MRTAVEQGERLAVSYYVGSRDELTERTIEPHLTFLDRGRWYVVADDSASGTERHFRVDRIERATPTGEHFARRAVVPPTEEGWFTGAPDVRTATLRLPPAARWVEEAYPTLEADEDDDGWLRVTLLVMSERWLERLLLRVGPEAEVLAPDDLVGVGARAATRLLARYA